MKLSRKKAAELRLSLAESHAKMYGAKHGEHSLKAVKIGKLTQKEPELVSRRRYLAHNYETVLGVETESRQNKDTGEWTHTVKETVKTVVKRKDHDYVETNDTIAKKVRGDNKGSQKAGKQKQIENAYQIIKTAAKMTEAQDIQKAYEEYPIEVDFRTFEKKLRNRQSFRNNVLKLTGWDFNDLMK